MKHLLFLLAALVAGLVAPRAEAHIGSPAVVYDGTAGPYAVRVIIVPPAVIPGRAEINVRLLKEDAGIVKVTVLPVSSRAGLKGAPPADEALLVPGEPALRHAELWLMSPGSYSVDVTAEGALGKGTVIVPVVAVATQRLPMRAGVGVLLAVLGVVLFVGAASLAGAAARECTVPPDQGVSPVRRRRGIYATGLAVLVLAAALSLGRQWWNAVDRDFRSNDLYRANPLRAAVSGSDSSRFLHLTVANGGGDFSKGGLLLIPDHGKLMHLFMIRQPGLDAMAHLHPVRSGSRSFDVALPPLPDGRYRLYADITYETGFAATLTTAIDLKAGSAGPGPATSPNRDPDDSWHVDGKEGDSSKDVALVLTSTGTPNAGQDISLDVSAKDAAGGPVKIEPYIGMLGHAAVTTPDGSVFAHLHPVGTISMAAQEYFSEQAARSTGIPAPMDHSMHIHSQGAGDSVSFPYLFPKPGSYRLWVQTKVKGQVVTGVFDLTVAPGS